MIRLNCLGKPVLLVQHTELRQDAGKFVRNLGDPLEHGLEGLVFIGIPVFRSTLEEFLSRTDFARRYAYISDLTSGEFDSSSVTLVAHLSVEGFLSVLKFASQSTCYAQIDFDIVAFLRHSHEMSDFSELGWLLHGAWNAYFEQWENDEFRELLQLFIKIAAGDAAEIEVVVAHISARSGQGG